MLKKQYVKSRDVCKVTFELPKENLPAEIAVDSVSVAGDFNSWAIDATPMKHIKSTGSYKVVVDLEPEQTYQFRYVINGEQWCNESEGCGYVSNDVGSHNSVLQTVGP